MIDQAAVARYHRDGFIVVEEVFSAAEIDAMRTALDRLVADASGVSSHDAVYDLEPGHTPARPRVRRIKTPTQVDPLYDRMIRHPKLLAILTQLLGPDLRLYGSKINIKAADYGSPVEWHQDWAFYPHTNDDVLAVGVLLDDMTPDNGPMLMIPGSHRGPTHDHHQDGHFCGAMNLASADVDLSQAEMIRGRAGACSFHHVRTVHGSAQNRSADTRRLLLYEVAAADAWPLMGLRDGFDGFEANMLAGASTTAPRIVDCPVRMPLPAPKRGGSIYESQTVVHARYFDFNPDAGA